MRKWQRREDRVHSLGHSRGLIAEALGSKYRGVSYILGRDCSSVFHVSNCFGVLRQHLFVK